MSVEAPEAVQHKDQPAEFEPQTETERRLKTTLDEHNALVDEITRRQQEHTEWVNQAVARRHELLGQAQLLTEFVSKEKGEAEKDPEASG